jgi:hypothetical protein
MTSYTQLGTICKSVYVKKLSNVISREGPGARARQRRRRALAGLLLLDISARLFVSVVYCRILNVITLTRLTPLPSSGFILIECWELLDRYLNLT